MVGWVGPRSEGPFPRGFRPPGSPWGWLSQYPAVRRRGRACGMARLEEGRDDLRLAAQKPLEMLASSVSAVVEAARLRTEPLP